MSGGRHSEGVLQKRSAQQNAIHGAASHASLLLPPMSEHMTLENNGTPTVQRIQFREDYRTRKLESTDSWL